MSDRRFAIVYLSIVIAIAASVLIIIFEAILK